MECCHEALSVKILTSISMDGLVMSSGIINSDQSNLNFLINMEIVTITSIKIF